MIAMYDLEDNLVTIFDNYKECAKYFNTSVKVIQCHICRARKGIINKKSYEDGWCRLIKIEEDKEC